MEAPTLGAREAAAVIDRASSYAEPLRRRAEGLTWAIWGLVTAAIFLLYGWSMAVMGPHDDSMHLWMPLLWIPFVGAGYGAMHALWRTVGHAAPSLRTSTGHTVLLTVGWVVATIAVTALAFWALRPADESSAPTFALGVAWVAFSAFNLHGLTPVGRRTALVFGAVISLAGATAMLLRLEPISARAVAVAAAGGLPVAAGIWQALKG